MRGPVCVTWTDALCVHEESDGMPPDSFDVQTYGWIVAVSPRFTSIASEVLPDGNYRCVTHVPSGLIRPGGIVDLQEGDRDGSE